MKSAIIGTGRVGSTLAYCLVLKQLCDHLVIEAGFEVYRLKGYPNHAIATAASMVVETIVLVGIQPQSDAV